MNHFNLKSLAFYGIAISSVVVLFKVVTAYGETNLKAPFAIGGVYRLSAEDLPGCLQSDSLVLDIKQSGTYLFATLLPANANAQTVTAAAQKPSLSGRLSNQQLTLKGSVPKITKCNSSSRHSNVRIRGAVDNDDILSGQITLNSKSSTAEFTAEKEPLEEKVEK